MAFVLGLELLLPEVILDTRTQKTSIISISTKCLLLQEPLIRKKKNHLKTSYNETTTFSVLALLTTTVPH